MSDEYLNKARLVHVIEARRVTFQAELKSNGYEQNIDAIERRYTGIKRLLEAAESLKSDTCSVPAVEDLAFFVRMEDEVHQYLRNRGRVYTYPPIYKRAKKILLPDS